MSRRTGGFNTPLAAGYRRRAESLVVRRAKHYIHAHRFDEVRISDVVEVSGIGESAFHDAFVRAVGQTLLKYLRQLCLTAARECLLDTAKPRSIAA